MRAQSTISAPRKMGQGDASLPLNNGFERMRTVLHSNDPVRLSFLVALLRDAGIETVLLDGHVSAVEGSIGAFPRRLAVLPEDEAQARRVLREANEA